MGRRSQSKAYRAAIWAAASASVVLAALLWHDALMADGSQEARKPSAAAAPLPSLPAFHLAAPPPPEAYKAVLERPLFHPGRRPFAERSAIAAAERSTLAAAQAIKTQAPPAPVRLPPPQGVTLRGTIVSGPFRSAIFERVARKDYVRVEEGGQLEGWTLAKVTRSEILLKEGGQELSLKLEPGLR
jgi:hypothetical protein